MIEPTLETEAGLLSGGATVVIGCDEVGRGAIAGPVAVGMAAIVSTTAPLPPGVRDSKLLSATKRSALCEPIEHWVHTAAVGFASAHEVDEVGIVAALGAAGMRAFQSIATRMPLAGAVVLLDGSLDWLSRADPVASGAGAVAAPARVLTQVKADQHCGSVAAASILAKVTRDRMMIELDQQFVGYGFSSHKGYGTAAHFAALETLGPCAEHRVSWLHQPTMW